MLLGRRLSLFRLRLAIVTWITLVPETSSRIFAINGPTRGSVRGWALFVYSLTKRGDETEFANRGWLLDPAFSAAWKVKSREKRKRKPQGGTNRLEAILKARCMSFAASMRC